MSSSEETLPMPAPPTSDCSQAEKKESVLTDISEPTVEEMKRSVPLVDKHYRSLLKAVSWRVTGTLDTMLISFLITGKIKLAVSIGFVEVFTKIGLFYLHERLWARIPLGRPQPPEDYLI